MLIGLGRFGRRVVGALVPAEPEVPDDPLAALLDGATADAGNPFVEPAIDERDGRAEDRDPSSSGRPESRLHRLQCMVPDDDWLDREPDEVAAELTERAEQCCRRLLGLENFVATTEPTDARGPQLDIFVVASLDDPGCAGLVPALVESLAARLRAVFRPILGVGEGALAICPVLAAPRREDSAPIAEAIHRLAALARHADRQRRPQARIYLVEDQSGKYLLSLEELERSFAAFLSLVLLSRLRDAQGIRDLVDGDGDDRAGPLATFACATLEIDMAALAELCAIALARDVLERFEPGTLPLSEIAGEAHPLVPDPTAIEAELDREDGPDGRAVEGENPSGARSGLSSGSMGSLEAYLEPPRIPVPEMTWTDSPENITERKLGAMWRLDCERTIERFIDDVERFKMDRLAERIERNGTALAERITDALGERVRGEILSGPRGPGRALELVRYAATRARGLKDQARARIDAPDLRRFPENPLDAGVAEVERAAHAWPRRDPFRLRILSALCALCIAFAVAGLCHLFIVTVVLSAPISARGSFPWWISGLLGAAVAGSMMSYNLWRHIKRHHNWLRQARDDLDQSLVRYLRRDIVDYFRRRLAYTRSLWSYRIYRAVTEQLEELVAQLEGSRAAVAEARRRLAAMERELLETSSGHPAHDQGLGLRHESSAEADRPRPILYRTILRREIARALYQHVAPPELTSVASRYHDGVHQGGGSALDALYADPLRALDFARRELGHVGEVSPYEQADTPLFAAVSGCVTEYLQTLALKLSPPLEINAAAADEAPRASHTVVAPPEAHGLIERILADENLDSGWMIRAHSRDTQRIHLLLERGGLPVESVVLARSGSDADAGPGPGSGASRGLEGPR